MHTMILYLEGERPIARTAEEQWQVAWSIFSNVFYSDEILFEDARTLVLAESVLNQKEHVKYKGQQKAVLDCLGRSLWCWL